MMGSKTTMLGRLLAQALFILVVVALTSEKLHAGVIDCSIIKLIAQGEQFQGKEIMVKGFLVLGHEESALYLSKDDAEHLLTKNALWLALSQEQFDSYRKNSGKYVMVRGVFNASNQGHLTLFSGAIEKISEIEEKRNIRY